MPIHRQILQSIKERMFRNKAILILGPRQVGKSTLCESLLKEIGVPWLYLNGDEADVRAELTDATSARLRNIIGEKKVLFIDEAQRIPGIGLTLKIIVDQIKDVQVIATGSSAFDLANLSNEPLTGRKFEFFLFPLSFGEMVKEHGLLGEKRMIEQRMIYGYYPDIVTQAGQEQELLKLLAGSYLYKDLLMLEQINKPVLLEKLLKALALQIGSEVNYHELGQIVSADKNTVEKYIDLLEKAYVVFRVSAFNRNVRTELKKGKKIYFYDCGIRNAILGNFNSMNTRTDVGALWENYFLVERMKFQAYRGVDAKLYFWRTTAQQEIDFIEESEWGIKAIECKWNSKSVVKFPKPFTDAYPDAELRFAHQGNFEKMIGFDD